MMAEGEEVTVARVADAADISRATAYRYFSDPEQLVAEAGLDVALMPTDELLDGIEDVRARVHAVARYYLEFTRAHEPQFRLFIAYTMRRWVKDPGARLRGARRTVAFGEALGPVKSIMERREFDDLVMRLSMLTGMEALISQSDILRVDAETGYRLQAGIVDALLDRYLPDA